MSIHPTAIVDPGARLERGVSVGAYAVVGPGVYLGRDTAVGSHACIERDTRIGENCRVYPHAVIGGDPQDKGYDGAPVYCEIGDRTSIREFATINRGSRAGGVTRVGSDCLLMTGVHIAHDCQVADRVIMANCATLAGHVHVEDRVVIGGLAAFHQFVRVGRLAMIGGTAGIMQDVPPFCMVQGSPPATLHGLNRIGMIRNGVTEQSYMAVKQAYRLMFRRGMTRENALAEIEASVPRTPEVTHFLDWLKAASKRGISKSETQEATPNLAVVSEGNSDARVRELEARLATLEERLRRLESLDAEVG